MWYTVNASGDEFVRMRIRCHEHPVRACDALTCTSPGGFSVPTRELQTLNSVPEYIFKHLLYGFRLVILLISYLYFFRKTYICYVLTATYVAMIKKNLLSVVTHQKSFVIGTSVAHFLSSENFLFHRDMISYTIKNRTAFF